MSSDLILAPEIKKALGLLVSVDKVSDKSFDAILKFVVDTFSSSCDRSEVKFSDQKPDDFQTLALALNVLFAELARHSLSTEHIECIISHRTPDEESRLHKIVDCHSKVRDNVSSRLKSLRTPRTLPNVVDFTVSRLPPFAENAEQARSIDDNSSHRNDVNEERMGGQVIYMVEMKLDNGTILNIDCDKSELQDMLKQLKDCSSQLGQ